MSRSEPQPLPSRDVDPTAVLATADSAGWRHPDIDRPSPRRRVRIVERRARLMVQCACELTGIDPAESTRDIHLPLSAAEFDTELRARYGTSHPELVYRTEVTIQRARLNRSQLPGLPRVILSNGESSRS